MRASRRGGAGALRTSSKSARCGGRAGARHLRTVQIFWLAAAVHVGHLGLNLMHMGSNLMREEMF